ncbi:MAG: hypothetical protein RLZZ219_1338 [Cyanobacteriota bacterium]
MFLQLLTTMLQAIDGLHICHTATTQRDALTLCRRDPPDLVILDLSLPDGDGLAVAQLLAEIQPQAQVIVLSGHASSFICPAGLAGMVRGVVDKTSAFRQLQEVLERCLNRQPTSLTTRQRQIFALIGQGLSNREIAAHMGLSVATVETHRKAIARKVGVSGADLVRRASLLAELNQGA